jgi:hypothetical protein
MVRLADGPIDRRLSGLDSDEQFSEADESGASGIRNRSASLGAIDTRHYPYSHPQEIRVNLRNCGSRGD